MKKVYWTLIFALFVCITAQAQISFIKFYGAPSLADFGADVHLTPQGGFDIAGTGANGSQKFDMFLLETDTAGNAIGFQWYGGPKNDYVQRLVPLSDGGRLLLGYTYSFGNGGEDGYAIRLDAAGEVVWSKTIGGLYYDQITDGLQLPDGSFVIGANIYDLDGATGIRVERWDASGNLIAFHNINVAGDDYCRRLLATPDGILVAGVLGGEGFISKIQTTTLEEIWFKTYSSASATPHPLVRIDDLIARSENNRYLAVGRASGPNVNTVFSFDGDGNVLSKFNTLLSGAVAVRLALGPANDVFIAGDDNIEHRDSAGMFLNENNGFDAPFDVPESIKGMIALPSGGIAVVGNTTVYQQGEDAMFSVFDPELAVQSSQLYWNLGPNDHELGYAARQTPDGGYILYGEKFHPEDRADGWLVKTDELGNVVWETATGGSTIDRARSLGLSADNTILVTGFSYDFQLGEPAVFFVRKFDLEGTELWAKFFPLGSYDFSSFSFILGLSDGGSVVALCAPLVTSTRRPTLLRLDAQGNVLWTKVHDNFNASSFLRNLIETPEGNLLGVGSSSPPGQFQAGLFDETGDEIWSQTYGSLSGTGYGLAATPNGNYVISGTTDANEGESDSLYIAAIDGQGALIWENYYDGESFIWPRGHINEAGDIFLASTSYTRGPPGSDIRYFLEIRKLSADGTLVGISEVDGFDNILFFDSHLTADGGLMAFGYADHENSMDYCLVKTNAEGLVGTSRITETRSLPKIFPSPAQHDIQVWWQGDYTGRVELRVFDVLGNLQKTVYSHKNAPVLKEWIEVSHFPAGTYFVQLVTSNGIVSRPFIKG